jgi:hypothetical protein
MEPPAGLMALREVAQFCNRTAARGSGPTPVKLTGVSELNQDGDVDTQGEVGALLERPPV